TACSPQAWATGAPLLVLRTLLGLDSDGTHLIVDPAIPAPLGRIELLSIPGCWGRMDAFGRAIGSSEQCATDAPALAPAPSPYPSPRSAGRGDLPDRTKSVIS